MKNNPNSIRERLLSAVRLAAADESVQLTRLPSKFYLLSFLSDCLEDALCELDESDKNLSQRLGLKDSEWIAIREFADAVFHAEQEAANASEHDYFDVYGKLSNALRNRANELISKHHLEGDISVFEYPLMNAEEKAKWSRTE